MARLELPTEIRKTVSDPTPLYVVAGAGDLLVERLRTVPARLAGMRAEVPAPREVGALPILAAAKALELSGIAGEAYDDLARRGKSVVTRIRRQKASQELAADTKTTVRRTKATTATAKSSATRTRTAAKGAATSARRTTAAARKAAADGAGKVG